MSSTLKALRALSDSASAIYGADAMGGVIQIVTPRGGRLNPLNG